MHFVTLALIASLVAVVVGAALYVWDGRKTSGPTYGNWYFTSLGVFWSGSIASVIFGITAIVGAAGSYGCERRANGLDREWRWGHAVGCQVRTHDGWVDFDKLRITSTLEEEQE